MVALLGASCSHRPETKPSVSSTTAANVDISACKTATSLKDEASCFATALVKKFGNTIALMTVNVTEDAELNYGTPFQGHTSRLYIFRISPKEMYIFNIDQDTGSALGKLEPLTLAGNLVSIDNERWNQTLKQAITTSDLAAANYTKQHPGINIHVTTAILTQQVSSDPLWHIVYSVPLSDFTASTSSVSFYVNANTGNILPK